ncbi:MAG TPA: hypothetical protein P5572_01535 [Phycisphaerae bacterium]|nr:hypothetical protein [Phycisphaerales bacterium]HRX83681.1 hypothetical protein [Phycisphaerae bacterium]
MSIRRQGSSRIEVDDVGYRWIVSGNDGFLDLVIEQDEVKGQRLVIQMDYEIGQITPRLVAALIPAALARGWTPDERRTQLYWRWRNSELTPIHET